MKLITSIILLVCLICGGCSSSGGSNISSAPSVSPDTVSQVTLAPVITVPPLNVPEITTEFLVSPTPTTEADSKTENLPTPSLADNDIELLHVGIVETTDTYNTGINDAKNSLIYSCISLVGDDKLKYPELQAALDEYNNRKKDSAAFSAADLEAAVENFAGTNTESYFYGLCDETTVSIERADSNYLSVYENWYGYYGGAHPNYSYRGINLDVKTGQLLTIYDVITDMDRFIDIIDEKLKAEYADIYDDLYLDLLFGYKSDNSGSLSQGSIFDFTLTNEGITVYFNPYILASYAYGAQIIDIRYDEAPEIFPEKLIEKPSKYVLSKDFYYSSKADIDGDGTKDSIDINLTAYEDDYNYAEQYDISVLGKTLSLDHSAYLHDQYLVWELDRYYLYFYEFAEAQTILSIIDLSNMNIVSEQSYVYELVEHPTTYDFESLENGERTITSYHVFTDPDLCIR